VLSEITEKLGFEEYIRTDYGDESQYRTPWEIFDRESAEEALSLAHRAQDIARKIIEQWPPAKKTKQALRPVVKSLREALGENRIALVLFGSRARGEQRRASDPLHLRICAIEQS
jgi:hypothetical protein